MKQYRVRILVAPHERKVIVTGPDTITFDELAQLVGAAIRAEPQPPLSVEILAVEEVEE